MLLMCVICLFGSSSCSLNNIPTSLAFAAASVCGFSVVYLRLCPNSPWFRVCGCFLACTLVNLRLYFIILHNLRNYSVLFGNDASRLGFLYLLD